MFTLEVAKCQDSGECGGPRKTDVVVGFAAETDSKSENLVKLGTEKLRSKSLDLMYVNNVTDGAIFGSDSTQGVIIDSNEKNIDIPEISKDTLSDILLDQLVSKLG